MAELVSAIIPTYNYARFVGRAIDSVLAQTYEPIECIVVDDGSTDDTPATLARYGDRIVGIRQENRGLSGARNTGIEKAKGEYLALLDADDWWEPNKIAEQVNFLRARPEIDAVGCAMRDVDQEGTTVAYCYRPNPTGDRVRDLQDIARRHLWIGGSASGILLKKSVFDQVGLFDETLSAAEDWDMWLRIVDKYRIGNLPLVLINRRVHGSGVFRNVERMQMNQRRVYEKARERWPDEMTRAVCREVEAMIVADAGGEYMGARDWKQAFNCYARAVRQWPYRWKWWRIMMRLTIRLAIGV